MSQGQETSQTQQQAEQLEEQKDTRLRTMLLSLVVEIGLAGAVFYFLSQWTFLGGIIAAVAFFLISFFLVAYFKWAPNNLCFTFVEEGTAKIVVFGGKAVKVLIQWKGRTLDAEGSVVNEDQDRKEPWHLLGGFRFYGIWPFWDIHIYPFSWTAVLEDGEFKPHIDELLDRILLMTDVYGFTVEDAEDSENMPLKVRGVLTGKVVNPYKSAFAVQRWLEAVMNRIVPWVRDQLTQSTYAEFIKAEEAIGKRVFDGSVELRQEFEKEYGFKVEAIEISKIDPAPEWREATLRETLAKRNREAVLVEADAESRRIEKVYGQIAQQGSTGKLIRTLEAVEKSPLAASLAVQAIPGVQEVMRGVFEQRGERGGQRGGRRRRR